MSEQATATPEAPVTAEAAAADGGVRGRCAFHVETSAAGLVVQTVFAADDGRVMVAPAVFPDLGYALEQIDALRRLAVDRFSQAAAVGAQVIAAQRAKAAAEMAETAAAAAPAAD